MDFKRMLRFLSAFFVLASVFWIFIYGCDSGLDADFFPGIVRGTININQKVPQKTDEIQIFLLKNFPPTSADLANASRARILNLNRSDSSQSVPFEMDVDPLGEFGALIAVWKRITDAEQPGDIDPFLNTIGGYCDANNEFIEIALTEEQPVAEGIDFDVSLTKVNRTTRISGAVNFTGTWPQPDSINFLALAFASDLNISLCNLPEIHLLPTEQTDSIDYDFEISAGVKVMIVAWANSISSIQDFKIIALGFAQPTDEVPATGINLTADFDNPVSLPALKTEFLSKKL